MAAVISVNGCDECNAHPNGMHAEWCSRGKMVRKMTKELDDHLYGKSGKPFDLYDNPLYGDNMVPLRPVLAKFAEAMEIKLRKNDDKTGWRELPIEAIKKLLYIEFQELEVAIEFLSTKEAMKECVDLANFALILHDRLSMEEDNGASK